MNQSGERNGCHKLTERQVVEIRRTWANNKTAKDLAAIYNVAPITITKVVNQMTWTHLPSVDDYRREYDT